MERYVGANFKKREHVHMPYTQMYKHTHKLYNNILGVGYIRSARVSSQGLSKVEEQAFYRNTNTDKENGQYRGFGAYGAWCTNSSVCRAAARIDLLQES